MLETEGAFDKEVRSALKASFISTLPRSVTDRLLADAVRIDIAAGTVVYRVGDPARLGLVVNGLVRVYMTSHRGRQVTITYGRRGDVLGLGLVLVGTSPTDCQAVTDSAMLTFNPKTLCALAKTEASFAWAMAVDVASRHMDVLDELAGNVFGSINQRIARHLLDLAARRPKDGVLLAAVSQQELADAVASVREVVNRVLCRLRANGVIDTTPDGIVVLDPIKLHAEAWRSTAVTNVTPPSNRGHSER